MNMLCATAVLWAAGSAVAVPPPSEMSFSGTGLMPGFSASQMFGVSGDGSVAVGQVIDGARSLAVVWSLDGGLRSLGELKDSLTSVARAASFDGSVIVGQSAQRAFRWTASGGMEDLGVLAESGEGFSSAWGVSADGSTVVGTAQADVGFRAFRWKPDAGMQDEGHFEGSGISSSGSAFVGMDVRQGGGFVGVRVMDGQGATDLGTIAPTYDGTIPHAITADASIVVGECTVVQAEFPLSLGFVWQQGVGIRSLGDFAGGFTNSRANDVSEDGQLIVGYGNYSGGRRAAVWVNGGAIMSARDYLVSLGVSGLQGWNLRDVTGVSADGRTLVGWGVNPDGALEGWVARIPAAPSVGGLAACVVLAARRRR